MLLKRWQPFAELRRMDNEMDRIWRHTFRPLHPWPRFWEGDGRMAIDVYQDAENLKVRATMPGVKPEDMEVTGTGNTLTIKGKSKFEKEVDEEYLHREHRYGALRRSVTLPQGLEIGKADASYENGVLTVTIPRSEESRAKTLKIEVKSTASKEG